MLTVAGSIVAGITAAGLMVDLARADSGPADSGRIESLVQQLGSAEYWKRESAAAELRAIGPAAIDSLLAAAERTDDLEIALAARWLVDGIPLAAASDPAEVAELLGQYARNAKESLTVMRRLLRLDDEAGIEPLARIVRLDRSPTTSLTAAALIAGEWRPGDPSFAAVAAKVRAGVGASTRPTAAFLRALAGFGQGDAAAIDTAVEAIDRLRAASPADPGGEGPVRRRPAARNRGLVIEDHTIGLPIHPRTALDRTFVAMLVAAGRRERAIEESRKLLAEAVEEPDDLLRTYRIASLLAWSAELGVPHLADEVLGAHAEAVAGRPIALYAAAIAVEAAGDADRGAALALDASRAAAEDHKHHLDAASRLSHWGRSDWAIREYESLTANPAVSDGEFVAASLMMAEHLHDLARHADAAACLRRLLEPGAEPAGGNRRANAEDLLRQLGRDPRSTRSRMLYFEAKAAEVKGDRQAFAATLDRAIEGPVRDVDALIAAYQSSADAPDRRERIRGMIRESLSTLESEIEAEPEEANPLNEYAWLAANTEGDAERAIRYSKRSLSMSFDNASYLDTLAHGQAAAGQVDRAIRTQSVAARLEPYNRTIRRNLERFRGMAPRANGTP